MIWKTCVLRFIDSNLSNDHPIDSNHMYGLAILKLFEIINTWFVIFLLINIP
ncbi:MAG: hypothetical protein V9E90_16805 [Saprospiraceae bacterium]